MDTSLQFSGNPKFSNNGSKILILRRKGDDATPQINYYDFFQCDNIELISEQIQSGLIKENRGLDWYYLEQ